MRHKKKHDTWIYQQEIRGMAGKLQHWHSTVLTLKSRNRTKHKIQQHIGTQTFIQ